MSVSRRGIADAPGARIGEGQSYGGKDTVVDLKTAAGFGQGEALSGHERVWIAALLVTACSGRWIPEHHLQCYLCGIE